MEHEKQKNVLPVGDEDEKKGTDRQNASAQGSPQHIEGAPDYADEESKGVTDPVRSDLDALPEEPRLRGIKRRRLAMQNRILTWTPENDIRYRGFLSYRGLRIAAWLCLILSQVGYTLSFAGRFDSALEGALGSWPTVLRAFLNFMSPLFIMATFGIILNNSRKFRSLLCMYGGFVMLFYLLFCLVYDRYLVGVLMRLGELTREEASAILETTIAHLIDSGFFTFNIFVDLFLCTLFTFFLVYKPKRIFVGKKLIAFRALAFIPVAYEIASIVVKALASVHVLTIPPHLFPLLTTKPPLTFFIFIALAIFIKKRERLFQTHGKSEEEYGAFLHSKLNSLQFSEFAAKQFAIIAVADLVIMVVMAMILADRFEYAESPIKESLAAVSSWGLGDCSPLLLIAPFLLLFSYTRTHKDTRPDIVINLVGIAILALIYLETLYQVVNEKIASIVNELNGLV